MKILAKILLTIFSIPIFILLVLSINIRFQFLGSDYWTSTLKKGNVYQKVSNRIRSELEAGVVEGGGDAGGVTDLSTLLSEENVEVFFEENIASFVNYANQKSDTIMITLPFSNNVWDLSQKMELTEFLDESNIEIFNEEDIKNISQLGKWSWIAFCSLLLLTILIYLFIYLLTTPGKRLVSMGLAGLLSGIGALSVFFAGGFAMSVISRDFATHSNIGKSIIAIVAAPVIKEVTLIWLVAGIFAVITGMVLFFFKKSVYNQGK